MTTSNNPIIGVAGTFASGQDTVAEYLRDKHGFMFISTSNLVREEAKKRYGSIERPVLVKTATELRNERGGGVLVDMVLDQFNSSKDKYAGLVVSGIRSLGEAKSITNAGGVMVFVDAPLELRYERMKSRARDAEAKVSIEEFREREAKEASTGSSDADFNREAIRPMADFTLINDSTLQKFEAQIEQIYSGLNK